MNLIFTLLTNKYIYNLFIIILKSKIYTTYIDNFYQKSHHKNVKKRNSFHNVQAALALNQLKNMNNTHEKRKHIANTYINTIKNISGFNLISTKQKTYYSFILFFKNPTYLQATLYKKGIDIGIKDYIIKNCGNIYKNNFNYNKTNKILNKLIELPLYPQLNKKEINFITSTITKLLK
jgi:dTDP-4-amino-4,6-dideoxygalactose transaminase